jgi:hypothetical protein
LICEKLLGLTKHCRDEDCLDWRTAAGKRYWGTPSFTTWAEAGLILDALISAGVYVSVHHGESGDRWKAVFHWDRYESMTCKFAVNAPAAIRAAALDYVRSLP